MKILSTVLFLLLSQLLVGQVSYKKEVFGGKAYFVIDTTPLNSGTTKGIWIDPTLQKSDTIPVLLLVTDSAWDGAAYHLKGYSVRIWDNTSVIIDTGNLSIGRGPRGFVHSHYIDKYRRPLSKNIVVWNVIK